MLDVNRCRHCYGEPYTMFLNGAWIFGCNCLLASDSANISYSDYDEAVAKWNRNYGVVDIIDGFGKQGISFTCTCDSKDLFWYGCRCNYAKSKHNKST